MRKSLSSHRDCRCLILLSFGSCTPSAGAGALKIVYSSADASNFVWYTAQDGGIYRKHGLEVELIFIQSSTMSVSTYGFRRYSDR